MHADNLKTSRADQPAHWLPQPGRHTLQLTERNGALVDRVSFEVRAMKGKSRQ